MKPKTLTRKEKGEAFMALLSAIQNFKPRVPFVYILASRRARRRK